MTRNLETSGRREVQTHASLIGEAASRSGHAPSAAAPSVAWSGSSVGTQILALTGRSLRSLLADRRVAIVRALQPLVLLGVISQVFGSLVNGVHLPSGVSYLDYLVPAVMVTSGISSATTSGMLLSRDMENGVMARFRSLPIRLLSVLVARSLADLTRVVVQLAILVLAAWAVFGFSPEGHVIGVTAALLLALIITWALIWLFIALSTWLRSLEAMTAISAIATFPLMFCSNAFAPLDSLPLALRWVATVNPLTYAVEASRSLCMGQPDWSQIAAAVVSALTVAIVGFMAAVRTFGRHGTDQN